MISFFHSSFLRFSFSCVYVVVVVVVMMMMMKVMVAHSHFCMPLNHFVSITHSTVFTVLVRIMRSCLCVGACVYVCICICLCV